MRSGLYLLLYVIWALALALHCHDGHGGLFTVPRLTLNKLSPRAVLIFVFSPIFPLAKEDMGCYLSYIWCDLV